jgi:hypothetical protein
VAVVSEFTASRENGRRRPRGYAAWRPQAKTRRLLDQVQVVLDEYEAYLPLTVRQIFYRLVGSFAYEKTERAYDRLAEHLVRARRARLLPFDDIRDDGITTFRYQWFHGVESFWDAVGGTIKSYRRDRQAGQTHRLELWCEAAGMAPQLARVADRYSVPVFSSGGFSSLTAVRMIVDRACERDQPTVLLHVGDFDPSGASIFEAMSEDAVAFLEEDRVIALQRIIPVRVALTGEQVSEYDLPTAPPKASDSRSKSWRGETCQLEALAPDALAELVSWAIEEWFDVGKLAEQVEHERADRAQLFKALPRGSA